MIRGGREKRDERRREREEGLMRKGDIATKQVRKKDGKRR